MIFDKLPTQFKTEAEGQAGKALADNLMVVTVTSIIIPVVVNLFLRIGISYIWGVINSL